MKEEHITHPIAPVWDENSRVLILGSFPSVKSRENGFFYGHRQNRFWKVLSAVFDCPVPKTTEEKKRLLLQNSVALWDVIASCDITGSADSSIKNAKPNDILPIIMKSKITAVFVNGNTAAKLYEKYLFPETKIKATVLPSTSPANARFTLEMLVERWKVIQI
ncbi:MAG: DNA-deoxyinosine glycosylase [Clostridia bacterium]|nr:DNA-deoxyinosine glycosylase [Clostridia bacterium]